MTYIYSESTGKQLSKLGGVGGFGVNAAAAVCRKLGKT